MIDALLRDPQWSARIAADNRGPRVGALGHSAGGYTTLALAGGRPDLARLASHCEINRAEDPLFCGVGRDRPASQPTAAPPATPTAAPTVTPVTTVPAASAPIPTLEDARVRAVVVMAPVGAVFSAQSLAQVRVPVALFEATLDRYLVSRFHAAWIASNLPGATFQRVDNAWHFAFMDTPSAAIPSPDGDLAANPPGFDRAALMKRLASEIPAFFDKAW